VSNTTTSTPTAHVRSVDSSPVPTLVMHRREMLQASRGEIWVVDFEIGEPFGREFGKSRPAVVISRQAELFGEDMVFVVPMTSRHYERVPTEVYIVPTSENRLIGPGLAVTHHLRSIDARRLRYRIGRLDEHTFGRVLAATARCIDIAVVNVVPPELLGVA